MTPAQEKFVKRRCEEMRMELRCLEKNRKDCAKYTQDELLGHVRFSVAYVGDILTMIEEQLDE